MWKRKEENEPVVKPGANPVLNPFKEVTTVSSMPQERKPDVGSGHEAPKSAVAHIGKSVLVKGELSGSEDLYIDGQVEGTIELREHNLTVGPNGRVDANVNAKEVILLGTVKGNIRAAERVEIRKTGSLIGDLVAARVTIEDGAYFKGSIDIQKPGQAVPKQPELKKPESPASGDIQTRTPSAPVEVRKFQ
jgi:cytoskeletal protein CcmA (bactofilin family)